MPTDRFILRYRGDSPTPSGDVARIQALPGLRVLDDSTSRMMLVEGPYADLEALVTNLPDWIMVPEQTVKLPDPRPRPRSAPE